MSRGPRSAPPDLPGFTPDRWIGGGGFADVFLYSQHRPARSVAIKILRREHLGAESLAQFDAEADIMAEISTHPYIVAIFASGVAPDGRPYIVMEHYPQPNFGERARGGAMDVSEVLRTGIQVASAVETAHRAGIIHRDIKPANILTSKFGRPGLTDFGISGVQSEGVISEAVGITVPYTAPELLDEQSAGSVATDVYGLAATVSALAAGHSPFWSPSGDNSDQSVLTRALAGTFTPITRPDIPRSLTHLLAQAMDPRPANRPSSAVALARSLQQIEQELRLQPTPIEVAEADGDARTHRAPSDPSDAESTRRSIQVVNPDAPPVAEDRRSPRPAPTPPIDDLPIVAASNTAAPMAHVRPTAPDASPPLTTPPIAAPGDDPDLDDAPTRARARPRSPAPSGTTEVGAAPRVPASSSRPPAELVDDDTVARGRHGAPERRRFVPPNRVALPERAGPAESPPSAPDFDDTPHRTKRDRHPLPWRMIGAVAALLAVVAIVAVVAMSGGHSSKAAPGDADPNAVPIQSLEAAQPLATPSDFMLSAFASTPGAMTAQLTWSSAAGDDVTYELQGVASPQSGGPRQSPVPLGTTQNTTENVVMHKDAAGKCTGVTIGESTQPASLCASGPPCLRMRATGTGVVSGNWVIAKQADDPDYDSACGHALGGMG